MARNSPTRVLLVRHGRTPTTGKVLPGRAKGLHLSEEGQAQAQAVAKQLSGLTNVAGVFCSPLERCKETAAPIGQVLGTPVETHRGLLECDFGDWTGAKLSAVAKLADWQIVQQNPSRFRFPSGESFLEMQARVGDAIARLTATHAGKTIVLISHADPIKAALITALGMPLDNINRLEVAPCSVSIISYAGITPNVLGVGMTSDFVSVLA